MIVNGWGPWFWPKRVARLTVVAAALQVFVPAPAHAQAPPVWPDTFVTRLEALALIQSLNAEILGSRSATLSLEKWCRDYKLAEEPAIVARVVRGADKAPSAAQRQRLLVTDQDHVRYRRVQLFCGNQLLSEAENWYVPGRLPAEANRLLETTTTPFGTAVQGLEPYRRTFDVKLLWSPLPADWALQSSRVPPAGAPNQALAIPDALFEHRAVLFTRDHTPFSELYEVYQRQILAFPAPRVR